MRQRLSALQPWLLGAALLLAFYAPLVSPDMALATRDVGFFHLPLRSTFQALWNGGPPQWNPTIHGGQPILSNPNYAAFYPPTWLALLAPPSYALNLLVLLHASLAFAGAWRLSRHLGCRPSACALAAVGYAASGNFVSLLNSFNYFCGMAWLPWALLAGDRALRAEGQRRWWRAAFACGGLLALQLLAGEPFAPVISVLAVGMLALSAARLDPRRLLRLLAIGLVAACLAAVQLLPTWHRTSDSPRAGGLEFQQASEWSTPPARLVELVFPHFYGDATRDEEYLFYGWGLHDFDFPYVVSLYPGLLLLGLGIVALTCWPIPRRGAWLGAAVLGLSLALGRHNPLNAALHALLPALGILRYPEKFIVLFVACVGLAGGLGWEHLLAERQRGRDAGWLGPLLLAGAAAAVSLGWNLALFVAPELGTEFIRSRSGLPPSPQVLDTGLAYLRHQAQVAALLGALVAGLVLLYRWRRLPEGVVATLAVALLAGDLWYYGHRFVKLAPAAEYREPPAMARNMAASPDRLFTDIGFDPRPRLSLRWGTPGLYHFRTRLGRLDPYSGTLWGISYALHEDFDLMLTGWARHALQVLHQDWHRPDLSQRILGAWCVGHRLTRRPPQEVLEASQRQGKAVSEARASAISPVLPRYRLLASVEMHPSTEGALAAARAGGYQLALQDYLVHRSGSFERRRLEPGQILKIAESGQRIALRYRSREVGVVVAAMTYHEFWQARVDGQPVPTYPTALGQLAAALPAGEGELVLKFRDPWVSVGAAVTLIALLAGAALLRRVPGSEGAAMDRSPGLL